MTELPGGSSSYFSAPSHGLDPHLFDAEHLKPDVLAWITATLSRELHTDTDLLLQGTSEWLYVWLAGSGITYQWDADRGNGDLDVLFGIDYAEFRRMNTDFTQLPDDQIANWLNNTLKLKLWPKTAHVDIHGQTYEVTFYVNPGVSKDIRVVKPYAAYDLRQDKWAVRPPTQHYLVSRTFPVDWSTQAENDEYYTKFLVERYGNPMYRGLQSAEAQHARELFEAIHIGRRAAFAPNGKGYGDFHNYRWQAAKQRGVIPALRGIIDDDDAKRAEREANLYGGHIEGADALMNRILMNRRPGT